MSERTREIAIRAAIGAQQRSLYWLVFRQTVVSTCLGVAVGLAAAVALAGLLTRFTVIGRLDLPILAGIAILHLAIALAVTYAIRRLVVCSAGFAASGVPPYRRARQILLS